MLALAFAAAFQLIAGSAAATELRSGGSSSVLYRYPVSADDISVGRTGEATLALRIPTFPAYLEPDLTAVYSSRGGDGPLGMGWSIPIAHIGVDLRNGPGVIDTSPDDSIVSIGGKRYLRERWTAAPGGPLVCEPRPGRSGQVWTDHDCFTDPRGPLRFQPSGKTDALSWTATDPMAGVIQTFGASAASRIVRGDKVVTWLIAREASRDGKEVRHFYEERAGSDERLRVAVSMGGDKVVRFIYEKRETNVLSNHRWTVRRTAEWLLAEIRLLDGCVPVQRDSNPDDIWTDFSSCDGAVVREKIVLGYGDPGRRYTGRYVLESWQHESGDGSVAFAPVKFGYNGDGSVARSSGTGIVSEQPATFAMPAGSTLMASAGNAPFQNYVDWNRDGLADWVDAKNDTGAEWPQPTADHKIHVSLRNASKGFDPRKSYRDPIARYAAWIWDDGQTLELHEDAMDKREPGVRQRPTTKATAPARIRTVWPEATIGINSSPWLYRTPGKNDTVTYLPAIEGLSLTVRCSKLGDDICADIKKTYTDQWNAQLGSHDYIGVKLTDLQDFDGDGYLDRVVSGLLVVWDPSAPDADANGWRDPSDGQPCIYVARFDPGRNDFLPFARYAIAQPSGDVAGLDPAFTSALAIEVTHNQEPTGADLSNHSAPMAMLAVAQMGLDILGTIAQFRTGNAAGKSAAGAEARGRESPLDVPDAASDPAAASTGGGERAMAIAGRALAVTDLLVGAINLATDWGGAPPEVQQAVRTGSTVYGLGRGGFAAVGSASKALAATTVTYQVVGWLQFSSAAVAVLGTVASIAVMQTAKKQMTAVGFNPGAVAAVAKTSVAAISIAVASVGLVATGVTIAIGGLAFSWTGVGLVVAAVGGLIALFAAIGALLSKEGSLEFSAGEVDYDFYPERGQVWRDKDVNSHQGSLRVLSNWVDLDGDGRVDLVVAKRRSDASGFAIASGDTRPGLVSRRTAPWRAWDFGGASSARELFSVKTNFYFKPDDVQRGDQLDAERGLGDLNGDGLLDLIDSTATTGYGLGVYLNTGRGFAAATTFAADAASAPPSCNQALHLARIRALSWTESVDKRTGYAVSLSNTIATLGPDLDNNGLPDLVLKDERSYDSVASGGPCVRVADRGMCDATMPTDPEPEKGNESCVAAKDVWFAEFDGWDKQDGTDEGKSHLTPAGFAVHSPTMLGDTYVAFNTGTGFTRFQKLDRPLPSFGGGLSVVATANAVNFVPSEAVTGTSHFLADPDASGRTHLIGLDITQKAIWNPTGGHPVKHRFAFGIENPDALTKITYPDGGVATLSYRIQSDVQGRQGPPMWVLDQVVFDDLARRGLQQIEGWNGSRPYVRYHYDGAELVGREFRGFAAIAEDRFSGTELTQIIQTYSQDGPTRGAVLCTEVRGSAIDNGIVVNNEPEHATCEAERTPRAGAAVPIDPTIDPSVVRPPKVTPSRPGRPVPTVKVAREDDKTRKSSPDLDTPLPDRPGPTSGSWSDDTGQVTSCYDKAQSRLGLPALYALQRRVENGYTSAASVARTLPDGTSEDIQRDFDTTRITTSTYNGSGRAAWSKLELAYDRSPFKTPRESVLSTSDGIRRKSVSRWRHERGDWAFLLESQQELERNGNVRKHTRFRYDTAAPFHVREVSERAGAVTRKREYLSYDGGGLPTQIREGDRTTNYTYVGERACGTGQLASMQYATDAFLPTAGVENWQYDCMGRTTRHQTASGDVSTFDYDRLGVLQREKPAGRGVIEYRHYPGVVDARRGGSALSAGAQTARVETAGGEQRWTTIWWDGFFREYRRGVMVEATRYLDFDWNGDGKVDAARVAFRDDTEWFARRRAQRLLTDRLLDGAGRVQCVSTAYLDGHDPEAYSSTLYDPLHRITLTRRFDGFEARTRFGVSSALQPTEHVENQLGEYATTSEDGAGRVVSRNPSGLGTTLLRYPDWGEATRITDGTGAVQLIERNAWDQPVRTCRQVSGAVPSSDVCPSTWPTTAMQYDGAGLVTRLTDPLGAVTKFQNGACGAPGRTELPPATTGDAASAAVIETSFDAGCRPSEVREANGSRTVMRYEPGGQVEKIVQAKGTPDESVTRYGYDELGRLLWTEDGLQRRRYRVADFRDQLIYEYQPDGTRRAATYDLRGAVATVVDATGHEQKISSDRMGRPLEVKWRREQCGAITPTTLPTITLSVSRKLVYDAKGRVTDSYDELGHRSHTVYDAADRVVRFHPPSLTTVGSFDPAQFEEYTYDRAGRLIAARDRGGHVTNFSYDRAGRVIRAWSDATGHAIEERYQYDLAGQLTRVLPTMAQATTANSCTVGGGGAAAFAIDYAYSPRGLVETETGAVAPGGGRGVTRTRYDASGDAVAVTDARGQTTQLGYDRLRRLVERRDADGAVSRRRFDAGSQLVESLDPRRLATTFTYDVRGRVTEVRPPTGVPSVRGYDANDRVTFGASLIDPAANRWEATRYRYSLDGQLRTVEPAGFVGATPTAAALTSLAVYEQCGDARGQVIATRDANQNVSQLVVDARGRAIERKLTPVYGGGWESVKFGYDADDLMTKVSAPMGGTSAPARLEWTTTYDGAHRPVAATNPYAADGRAWQYQDDGQVCRRKDLHGATVSREISTSYDRRGLVVERRFGTTVESFAHDLAGLRTTAKDASGTWAWRYDPMGRVVEQRQRSARLSFDAVTAYQYLVGGLLAEVRYPQVPGLPNAPRAVRFEYEATSDRLAAVRTDKGPVATAPRYDGADRVLAVTLGNGAVRTDRYDDRGRLTDRRVRFGAGDVMAVSHRLDGVGNPLVLDDHLDNAYDRTLTYDERGRLRSEASTALGGTWTFQLDGQDRVDTVSPPGAAMRTHRYDARGNLATVAAGATVRYDSDDFGNRVRDDGHGARFAYDALDRMTEATVGTTTTKYVHGFDTRRVEAGNRIALYGLGPQPLVEVELDATGKPVAAGYRVDFDGLAQLGDAGSGGNRFVATDHLGSPVLFMGATPGGEERVAYSATGRPVPRPSAATVPRSPIGFQGSIADRDLGLDSMLHRHYDPDTFEWLSPDPLGLAAGVSPHGFVSGNPLRFRDPLGLDEWTDDEGWRFSITEAGASVTAPPPPSASGWSAALARATDTLMYYNGLASAMFREAAGPDMRILSEKEDVRRMLHLAIDTPSIIANQPQHLHGASPNVSHQVNHAAADFFVDDIMTMNVVHTSLDVAGLIFPHADACNALLYCAEGDYGNAAISGFSIIPWGDYAKAARLPVALGRFVELSPLLVQPNDAYAAPRWSFRVVTHSSPGLLAPPIRTHLVGAEFPTRNRPGFARPKDLCPTCGTPPEARLHADTGGLRLGTEVAEMLPNGQVAGVGLSRDACPACAFEMSTGGLTPVTPRAWIRPSAFDTPLEAFARGRYLQGRAEYLHGFLAPSSARRTTTAVTEVVFDE